MPTGHYQRKYKPMADRFWSKVLKTETCWLWTGSTATFGHGLIYNGNFDADKPSKVLIGTHRVSYQMRYGPIPPGMSVCHKCDAPGCVNPDHLFLGSDDDNAKDMLHKGRLASRAKLAADDIRFIRSSRESLATLAERFCVSKPSISMIRNLRTWRHVAD